MNEKFHINTICANFYVNCAVNCDEEGFLMKQDTTSGNVRYCQKRKDLMSGHESELYAGSAYAAAKTDTD